MIEKKTIIDQIEIIRDGTIQIRLALLLIEDGQEIFSSWHRTAIPPGISMAEQISIVNIHLTEMNKPTIEDTSLLEILIPIVHTKEVKDKYIEKQSGIIEKGLQ